MTFRYNKYGNKITIYNGVKYHSKKEADWAKTLDIMVKGKAIKKWEGQFKISLIMNKKRVATYIADFLITNNDGSLEIFECKGVWTTIAKLKWKMALAMYGDKYKFTVI